MPWYRIGDPGADTVAHFKFSRKGGPAPCAAPRMPLDRARGGEKCNRPSVALCDAHVGTDLRGYSLTCDMPVCELHRTHVEGRDVDYCPRHQQLAPATLPLGGER